MKICIKQKLQVLKSYAKLVFNTFSFEPSKKEIFLVYREVPKLLEIIDRPSPPLPSLLFCFARRPPYTAGGPCPRCVRGQVDPRELSSATWPASWHLPTLTRVLGALPSRHAASPCSSPPAPYASSSQIRPGPNQPSPDAAPLAQDSSRL